MAIQDKFNRANTIYKVTRDIDLGGGTLTIPEGCTLDFQGGTISNGIIIGTNTKIRSTLTKIFDTSISISGTLNISEIYPEWFGAKGDGVTDDTVYIQKSLKVSNDTNNVITKLSSKYKVTSTLYIPANCGIVGTVNNGFSSTPQIIAEFTDLNSWVIESDVTRVSTGERIPYKGVIYGVDFDNNTVTRCSNIFIKDINIQANNKIYGGVRFMASPGYIRDNVGVVGTLVGFASYASWGISDTKLFTYCSLYGCLYGNDINALTMSNCYINCSADSEAVDANNVPDIIYQEAALDIAGYHGMFKTGIYMRYINGAVLDSIVSEHWEVGRIYINTESLVEQAPYLENISGCIYASAQSNIEISGLVGSNSNASLDFAFGANVTGLVKNMNIKKYNISNYSGTIVTMNNEINHYKVINLGVDYQYFNVSDSDGLAKVFTVLKSSLPAIVIMAAGNYIFKGGDIQDKSITLVGQGTSNTTLKVDPQISGGWTGLYAITGSQCTVAFNKMTVTLADPNTSFSDNEDKGFLKFTGKCSVLFREVNLNLNNGNLFYAPWQNLLNIDFAAINLNITRVNGVINNIHSSSGNFPHNNLIVNLYTWGVTLPASGISDNLFDWAYINQLTYNADNGGALRRGCTRFANSRLELYNGTSWVYTSGEEILPKSGPTSSRPTAAYISCQYYDTTLSKPIWWNGTVWKDATGATV